MRATVNKVTQGCGKSANCTPRTKSYTCYVGHLRQADNKSPLRNTGGGLGGQPISRIECTGDKVDCSIDAGMQTGRRR